MALSTQRAWPPLAHAARSRLIIPGHPELHVSTMQKNGNHDRDSQLIHRLLRASPPAWLLPWRLARAFLAMVAQAVASPAVAHSHSSAVWLAGGPLMLAASPAMASSFYAWPCA